ncbi:hypothetical protein [Flectobacillus major]|jgi:hypothetical protein|uniref:hypothetical protein n=1 Tax=Flectobacillus major TaxID=103 RepID=UPI0005C71FFE|nr:hypothetical protein [Flectobacillus major]
METYLLTIGFQDNDFTVHLLMNTLQKYFEEIQFVELTNKQEVSRFRQLKLVLTTDWPALVKASQQLETHAAVSNIQIMDLTSGDTPTLCGYFAKQRIRTQFYRGEANAA